MVGLMMDSQSDESTETSAVHEGPQQNECATTEQEKEPVLPSKTQTHTSQAEGKEEEDTVFKKPIFPSKTWRQTTKGEEQDEEEEVIFKKPIFPSRLEKQASKPLEDEEAVFKKPASVSKTPKQASKQDGEEEEEEEAVFKKPVFISKAQRQASKPDAQQEEGSNSNDQTASRSSLSFKSAQDLVEKSAAVPYKEPRWSGVPQDVYSFEVLKGGVIVEVLPLNRPFTIIGRQSQCDLVLEHPSLSRFHCVVQYRAVEEEGAAAGFYAYDLGSTHGSFHNKHRMKPHTYYRLHIGHMLKLGGSTRTLILQGPVEDQEPESEMSVTELMQAATERRKKLQRLETGEEEEEEGKKGRKGKMESSDKRTGREKEEEETGISWGMREDAVEDEEKEEQGDEDGRKNPFASGSEDLHLDDPKKTLRGWFERHGYDPPSYTLEETGPGCCRCSVELPVEGRTPSVVSVDHRGKRKEAVVQCAMEACRMLDRRNLLRQAKHDSHQQKKRDWAENDYYDSDEDDFLDRTGDIQRRRLKRMKASGAAGQDGTAETYDSLMRKYREATQELSNLEGKLAGAEAIKEAAKKQQTGEVAEDDLDSFMRSLKSEVPDKHKRVTWKLRAIELRKEELKLRRLVNISRPLGVPELQPYKSQHGTGGNSPSQIPGQTSFGARLKGLATFPTRSVSSQSKEPEYRVHKIFQEVEPKTKVRLRKLDDDGDDRKSVVKESRLLRMREGAETSQHHKNKSRSAHDTHPLPSDQANKSESQMLTVKTAVEEESTYTHTETVKTSEGQSSEEGNRHEQASSEESGTMKIQEVHMEGSSPLEKPARVLGPKLPPHLAHLKASNKCHVQPRKKEKKKYDDDNPNYDTWIPPAHQSGDGRTALNDRLGY